MKVGASVVSCRRGGNTASFDALNKYFTISSMPVASATYWNMVHGFTSDDVAKDLEAADDAQPCAKYELYDKNDRRRQRKIRIPRN